MLDWVGILDQDIFTVLNANDVVVGATTVYMKGFMAWEKGFPFFISVIAMMVSFKPRFSDTEKSYRSLCPFPSDIREQNSILGA